MSEKIILVKQLSDRCQTTTIKNALITALAVDCCQTVVKFSQIVQSLSFIPPLGGMTMITIVCFRLCYQEKITLILIGTVVMTTIELWASYSAYLTGGFL